MQVGATNDAVSIHVEAEAFLYKMVRLLVATLVATSRRPELGTELQHLLATVQGRNYGPAPANGLFLERITYTRAEKGHSYLEPI